MSSFLSHLRPASLGCPLCLLCLSGCASTQPTRSGFLSNYDHLERIDGRTHALASPVIALADYRLLAIAPIELRIDREKTGISAEQAESLQVAARDELARALSRRFRLVTDAARLHALILRAAITRVETSNAALNALTTAAILVPANNGGICLEWQLVDGARGTEMARGINVATGKPWQIVAAFEKIGQAQAGLRDIAEDMANLLSQPGSLPGAAGAF